MAVVDEVREALERTVPDFGGRRGDWAGVLAAAGADERDRRDGLGGRSLWWRPSRRSARSLCQRSSSASPGRPRPASWSERRQHHATFRDDPSLPVGGDVDFDRPGARSDADRASSGSTRRHRTGFAHS